MPIWMVKEEVDGQGNPTGDVSVFNENGNPTQTIKTVTPGTDPLWGPSLNSELRAAGVTEGISVSPTVVSFDTDRVPAGTSRNTLISVLQAHDPTTPKPDDPQAVEAMAMFNQAEGYIIDSVNTTKEQLLAFCQRYIDWYNAV